MLRAAVIGDTHDLLRPELLAAIEGVDVILHTGDFCSAEVHAALAAIAPLHGVRGNNDSDAWADALPEALTVTLEGVELYLLHAHQDLARLPPPAGTQLMLFGHSHQPGEGEIDGVRWLNPGSPGRRRFSLPVTCALLSLDAGRYDYRFVDLLQDAA